jgi:hypothetical protein
VITRVRWLRFPEGPGPFSFSGLSGASGAVSPSGGSRPRC